MLRVLAVLVPFSLVTACASFAYADQPFRHDGLLLRLGVGGGPLTMEREGRVGFGTPKYHSGDSKIAGGSGAFELTLGGSVSDSFVICALLSFNQIGNPSLELGNSAVPLDGPLTFAQLGIGVEWFPDPEGGFHVGASLAFAGAWAKSPPPRFTDYLGGSGGAISVDVGYALWVAPRWSVGLALRYTGARLHGEHTAYGITGSEDDSLSAAAFLLTAAFH